jgi:hypothetical protein
MLVAHPGPKKLRLGLNPLSVPPVLKFIVPPELDNASGSVGDAIGQRFSV